MARATGLHRQLAETEHPASRRTTATGKMEDEEEAAAAAAPSPALFPRLLRSSSPGRASSGGEGIRRRHRSPEQQQQQPHGAERPEAAAPTGPSGRPRGIPGRRMWFLGLNGAWAVAGGPWSVEPGLDAGSWGQRGVWWCGRDWSCGRTGLGAGPRFWGLLRSTVGCGQAGIAACSLVSLWRSKQRQNLIRT